jgi:transcriptional regulator with XRE-family HTH domain
MTQLQEMGYTLVPNEFAELCYRYGKTDSVIGAKLGVSKLSVRNWRKGTHDLPSVEILNDLQAIVERHENNY